MILIDPSDFCVRGQSHLLHKIGIAQELASNMNHICFVV